MARAPLGGPAAWHGRDMAGRSDWIHVWTPPEVAELRAAARAALATERPLPALRRADLPLPACAATLARAAAMLEDGPGLFTLRGLPAAEMPLPELRAALWVIGLHLGTAVSQNPMGELVAEVTDTGEVMGQATSRGYRAGGALRFHTDRCDVVALLCARQSPAGGDSLVTATPAIHDAMLARRPELLELLFGPWCHSRQGEGRPGERRWYESPVFAVHEGRFTCQYSRSYVETAQRFEEVPRVTPRQWEALDLLKELAEELALQTRMQPGDVQLLNNHVTLHARTALVEDPDPASKRLLYRLWLSVPGSRALPASFAELWGETGAGVIRGGVTAAAGYRSAADPRALEAIPA